MQKRNFLPIEVQLNGQISITLQIKHLRVNKTNGTIKIISLKAGRWNINYELSFSPKPPKSNFGFTNLKVI